jgi:hypothetical protein
LYFAADFHTAKVVGWKNNAPSGLSTASLQKEQIGFKSGPGEKKQKYCWREQAAHRPEAGLRPGARPF